MKYYWVEFGGVHALWQKLPDGTRQRLYRVGRIERGWRVELRDGAIAWKDFPYNFGSLQTAKDSVNVEVIRHLV